MLLISVSEVLQTFNQVEFSTDLANNILLENYEGFNLSSLLIVQNRNSEILFLK